MTIITARGKNKGEQFSNMFVNRPVWALASNNTLGSAQPVLSWFDEKSHIIPMLTTGPQASDFSRAFATEVGAVYGFCGQASTYTLTSAANPTTGYLSINMCHQTASMANFKAYSSGWADYYNATQMNMIPRFSIPIVGEKKWRQVFDFCLSGSTIYKSPIGNTWDGVLQGDRVALSDVTLDAGVQPWVADNITRMAYNRNNKTLVVLETTAAVAGTGVLGNWTFTAHYLKLAKAIGADTTCAEIRQLMAEALKNDSGTSYVAVPFTLEGLAVANATISGQQTSGRQSILPVLCNDGTLWIKVDGFNNSYTTIPLYSVDLLEDLATLTPHEAPVVRRRYAGGAGAQFYGAANGGIQGGTYMMSDDNTVVAICQHLYYYIQGALVFFCPTASAKANVRPAMFSDPSTSADPYTIAPCGGGSFVMCNSGLSNDAGMGAYIGKVEMDHMGYIDFNNADGVAPLTITPQWNGYMYPTVNAAALRGGNQVLKVMPSFEWM